MEETKYRKLQFYIFSYGNFFYVFLAIFIGKLNYYYSDNYYVTITTFIISDIMFGLWFTLFIFITMYLSNKEFFIYIRPKDKAYFLNMVLK